MEKNIILTGPLGFSGQHICREFRRNKFNLYTLDLDLTKQIRTYTAHSKFDVLIHTAYRSPDTNVTTDDLAKNVLATQNLIDWAKHYSAEYIIFFSSTSLYGEVQSGVLHRTSPVINPSVYGMTKLISERLFQESGITTTSLRLPLIIGKGCKRNWIARMNETAEAGKPVTVYNPMAKFNNAVHIDYVCEYIKELVDRFSSGYEVPKTCLLGSSDSVSIGAVARAVVNDRVPIIEEVTEDRSYIINIWGEGSSVKTPWNIHWTLHRYIQDLFGE